MKKIVVLFLISLFIISCVSGPPSNIDSIDKLVKNWAYGLEEKDIDTLMDTYWPEAVFTFIPPEGEEMVTKLIVRVDTAEREKTGSTITYTLFVETSDFALTIILELENRGNEWRIIRQIVKF